MVYKQLDQLGRKKMGSIISIENGFRKGFHCKNKRQNRVLLAKLRPVFSAVPVSFLWTESESSLLKQYNF